MKTSTLAIITVVIATITAGVFPPTLTAGILDQEYNPKSTNHFFANSDLYRAQVFTVGLTGQMERIEALMSGTGSSTFEIWPTVGGSGVPVANDIHTSFASGTIHFDSDKPAFAGVDITSANFNVTAGDVLALVQIGGSSTGSGGWRADSSSGGYGGGSFYSTFTSAPSGAWNVQGVDAGFRTFVVPEPASLSLFALGALMCCRKWRHKRM